MFLLVLDQQLFSSFSSTEVLDCTKLLWYKIIYPDLYCLRTNDVQIMQWLSSWFSSALGTERLSNHDLFCLSKNDCSVMVQWQCSWFALPFEVIVQSGNDAIFLSPNHPPGFHSSLLSVLDKNFCCFIYNFCLILYKQVHIYCLLSCSLLLWMRNVK